VNVDAIQTRHSLLSGLARAALVLYVALVALPAVRGQPFTFATYYTASSLLTEGPQQMERVYDDTWFDAQIARNGFVGLHDIFNIQPPTMSLMVLPLLALPPRLAWPAWTLLNLLWLLAGLVLLARALDLPARWGIWALPAALLYIPVSENIRAGQAYLLLFFLLCLLFWALVRPAPGHWGARLAGLALALMLMLKSAGSWLWPLLLLAGRWRILAWAVALAIVLGLAALPWVGPGAWASYIGWLPTLITSPKRLVTAYQTTTSLFGHLLVYDARWNPAPVADLPLLAWALTLATLLLTLVISARAARLADRWRDARALTLALWLAPIVASAPYGEGYHYTMVLPALLIAIWWAWRIGASLDRWVWGALALAVLLLGAPLPYKSARLEVGWLALLAYPRVYGAYLLWFVLAGMIRRASEPCEGVSG
jgi:Glycosyltransferase family 87